jgi:hypothetical protein
MPIDKNSGRRLSANKFKYGTKEDKIDFFKTYYPYAEQALNEYTPTNTVYKDIKVPVETLLAQAYIESTGGRAMPKFNYSGVKSPEGSKKGYGLYKTTEYFDTPDQYKTMEFDGKVILDTVKYKPRKPGEYRNLYSVEEVKEGNNAGRYKYSVDDYFFEGEDAVDAFKHTINNFYVTPQYKEALKAETVSDPDLFLKAIAPSYSTSKSYYETTSPIVADMKKQTDIIKQQNIDAENLIKQQQVQDAVNNILPEMITDSLSNKVLPKGKIPFSNVFNVPKLKDGAKNVYGKVEAQGGELVVRNTSGDYAVIPKEKRVDALRLMSEKNNYGLDELISKLPKMGDYAANGLVIGGDDPPFSSFASSKYKHVNVESGSKNKDGWIDKKDVRGTTMVNGQEQTVYGYPNTTKPTGYDRTITEIPKNNIPIKIEHEIQPTYDEQLKLYNNQKKYEEFEMEMKNIPGVIIRDGKTRRIYQIPKNEYLKLYPDADPNDCIGCDYVHNRLKIKDDKEIYGGNYKDMTSNPGNVTMGAEISIPLSRFENKIEDPNANLKYRAIYKSDYSYYNDVQGKNISSKDYNAPASKINYIEVKFEDGKTLTMSEEDYIKFSNSGIAPHLTNDNIKLREQHQYFLNKQAYDYRLKYLKEEIVDEFKPLSKTELAKLSAEEKIEYEKKYAEKYYKK